MLQFLKFMFVVVLITGTYSCSKYVLPASGDDPQPTFQVRERDTIATPTLRKKNDISQFD